MGEGSDPSSVSPFQTMNAFRHLDLAWNTPSEILQNFWYHTPLLIANAHGCRGLRVSAQPSYHVCTIQMTY